MVRYRINLYNNETAFSVPIQIREIDSMMEALTIKEEGNQYFKAGEVDKALAAYTKALNLNAASPSETAVLHKNRAACFLKQQRYADAVEDCTKGNYFN